MTAAILDDLRAALHASQRDDPLLPPLAQRLSTFTGASGSADRIDGWIALQDWTRHGARVQVTGDDTGAQLASGDTLRLRLLLHALEACTPVREHVQSAVAALFAEADACSLLAEAGMPSDRGFVAEATGRLWAKLLPEPRDTQDLRQFIRRCYRDAGHVARFQRWPVELFHRLIDVVMPPPGSPAWEALRQSVTDAMRLLCARVQAQGLAPKLRNRSRPVAVAESPFFRLARTADALLEAWNRSPAPADGNGEIPNRDDPGQDWQAALTACRSGIAEIHRQIGGEGISVDIVFSLDVLDRCLSRLELLGAIITSPPGRERSVLVHRLLARLVHHVHEARSLRALASSNFNLLHRRIVERSGETGEHYIARDRSEYRHLLLAAAGGGVLTVGTTAVKLAAAELGGSDFLHGLMYGLNYAVSFMILHHLHLVLATKQPAMTAATLATILREQRGNAALDEIVDRIARISHSQIAAAAGNVVVVALGALAFTTLWELTFGRAFLDHETAQKTYASFSPLNSGTLFYAALTGVILWLSSVVGGWLDNWSAWHRIPQGIADHPLGERLGRDRLRRWGETWRSNIAGWGTNISLGFMLGMTPALGHFFGLPLDVRHVTLSTGMLFTACGSLGEGWYSNGWFLFAIAGIASMFFLNLGVSFALSLWTAMRALEVPAADVRDLLRRLGKRMLTHPGDFILPPKTAMKGHDL